MMAGNVRIPLFKPFVCEQADLAVSDVLQSGYIGEGEVVRRFEEALAWWIGPCVTVNSGTSALWLAYDLAGIGPGDLVISTPMTCLATNIPLLHLGARILWADVDPRTGLIDPWSVEALLAQHKVKAIVAVDYGGVPAPVAELRALSWDQRSSIILDCAHSFGTYRNEGAHYRAYSFQAIKTLTTGDGGALWCSDPIKLEEARLKRWFGLDRRTGGFRCEQTVQHVGYKFHMNDIAAAIGLANLSHMEENLTRARRNAAAYDEAGLGHVTQASSCWLYTILVPNRDQFIHAMAERGIQCARVHSRNDVQPIFAREKGQPALPGVTQFDDQQVSIPVGWWLGAGDVRDVIEAVQSIVGKGKATCA